jgi:hypothetical protein
MTEALPPYDESELMHDERGPLPQRSLWWAGHRPETYALVALVTAVSGFFGLTEAFEVVEAFLINNNDSQQLVYGYAGGIRVAVALVAILAAILSIRSEDEDTTWSAPVARCALVVAVLAALLGAATIVGAVTASSPNPINGFGTFG